MEKIQAHAGSIRTLNKVWCAAATSDSYWQVHFHNLLDSNCNKLGIWVRKLAMIALLPTWHDNLRNQKCNGSISCLCHILPAKDASTSSKSKCYMDDHNMQPGDLDSYWLPGRKFDTDLEILAELEDERMKEEEEQQQMLLDTSA